MVGVNAGQTETPYQPVGDGLTQILPAAGQRIMRQTVQMADQFLGNEGRRLMLGFANGQVDGAQMRRRRNPLRERCQALEGISLQTVEFGVHGDRGPVPVQSSTLLVMKQTPHYT